VSLTGGEMQTVFAKSTPKEMTEFTRKNSDIFGQACVKKGAKNEAK
jgi:hypothetical protein